MLRRVLFCLLLGASATAAAQTPPAPLPAALRAELQALNLTPVQRAELMALMLQAQALRAGVQDDVDALIDEAKAELAQPDADLRTLALEREAVVDARLANLRSLRDGLIEFYYDDLDPTQQAQIRQMLLTKVERMERLRDVLIELRSSWVGG